MTAPNPYTAKSIVRNLLIFETCLIIIYWMDHFVGEPPLLHGLFNLDGEANIPAWFSSAQLLVTSMLIWLAAFLQKPDERPSRFFLFMAGAVVSLMSMDEIAQVHESVTAVVGARYIEWVPLFLSDHKEAIILILIASAIALRAIRDDLKAIWSWSRQASLIALSGIIIFITGAGVVETLGFKFLQTGTTLYKVEVAIEEFMEMAGVSIFLYAVIRYVRDRLAESAKTAIPV